MEEVVRGDPWGWFMAERASLVRLVEQAHAARLWERTWQLADLLPVMFDWRADWRSWEHTHQLALDAARQANDAGAEAGIMRSLGALYRELGRYDEAVVMLTTQRRSSRAVASSISGRRPCGTFVIPTDTRGAWLRPLIPFRPG
jgi:hypothetical protein